MFSGSFRSAGPDALTWLALRAGAGDANALEGFVEAAYDDVWRLCGAMVGGAAAEDAAQEAFVRAVKALPGFRGDSSARTWLLAIARHTCLDELRARSRRLRRAGRLAAERAEEDRVGAASADPSAEVAAAEMLRQLSPERRAAFVLTQMLGLPYRDAARVCECPVGTIRSRVARARADLIMLMEETGRRPQRRAN